MRESIGFDDAQPQKTVRNHKKGGTITLMKKLTVLLLLMSLLAAVIGCTPSQPAGDPTQAASSAPTPTAAAIATAPAASSEPAASETPAAAGPKEIAVNLASEPPEMNSILTTSTGSMNVLRHIVDGLVMLDQSDTPVPAIAESWTVSEDMRTYTFTLRQDAVWSNGEKVTAHDFIFAWNTHFTAETAAEYAPVWAALILGAAEKLTGTDLSDETQAELTALGYENIGYKAIDEYTLQITATGAYPYFLSVLAFPSLFPVNEKGYNEIGADNYGIEAEYILTNGAYKLTDWLHESSITLEKNPDYYNAANIKIDKITMEMITDTNTALNTFLAGDLDMVGLSGAQSEQMRGEGRTVLGYSDGSCWYFEYDTRDKGLNNAKIRKALTLGIDVDAFLKNVVRLENSTIAYGLTPPAVAGGVFAEKVKALNLVPRVTDGDYTAVKAMLDEGLAEEGMTIEDLKDLVLITDNGDTALTYVAFFQEQLRVNLGVEITVEQMTYESRLERMTNKDFSIVMAGWSPDYNDPMTFLDLLLSTNGNNHTSYSNPAYDELINKALVETDTAAREALLIECEKILSEDMPFGLLYNRYRDYICQDRLTGVVRTAFDDMNFLYADVVE